MLSFKNTRGYSGLVTEVARITTNAPHQLRFNLVLRARFPSSTRPAPSPPAAGS